MKEPAERRENRVPGYVLSVIANGVLFWVMNSLPGWNIPYLLPSYSGALTAINLSLSVQVAMNIVLIFYHPRFFHHLTQVVLVGFSIFAIATVAAIFPFDFASIPLPRTAPNLDFIARLALLVAIGGAAIGGIVHLVRFLAYVLRGEVER